MTTALEGKRVEWLYAHFQAISQSSDRLLAAFAVFAISALAVWLSPDKAIEVAFIKVNVDRQVLLGGLLVSAGFVFIAFCGNFDLGEVTLNEISKTLKCDYEDLWFIDTHPTFVDYARFRRPESANKRRFLGRAMVALVYPLMLAGTLAVISVIWGYEALMDTMRWPDLTLFLIAALTLAVAWIRAYEYVMRRLKTFLKTERARKR